MNCEEFELVVRDLARSDVGGQSFELSRGVSEHEQARERARIHVDACASCAARLQEERLLSRNLDSLALAMDSFEPPARIEAELLNAFRQNLARGIPGGAGILPASLIQRKSGQDARARSGLGVVGRTAYWLTAAAAVVLIVFGIVLVRAKLLPANVSQPNVRQANANVRPTNDVKTPLPDSAPSVAEPGGQDGAKPMTAKDLPANDRPEIHRIRRRPQQLSRPSTNGDVTAATVARPTEPQTTEPQSETEVTTQFIALSYVAPANLQDGGQIVRVELPRSAMASFGLPVNMDRFGERVKADVLVSADGFARAIRFVQ